MKFIIFITLLLLARQATSQQLLASDCECKSPMNIAIVGGEEVIPNSVPWQVSLSFQGSHICGATILNHQFVMTAAHCVASIPAEQIDQIGVRVGVHYLNDTNMEDKTHYAVAYYYDRRYGSGAADGVGDFALVEIGDSISFDQNVQPGCLPAETDADYSEGSLRAVGWGATERVKVNSSLTKNHFERSHRRIDTSEPLVIKRTIEKTMQRKRTKPFLPKNASSLNSSAQISNVLKGAYFNQVQCQEHLVCVEPVTQGDSVCFGDSGSSLNHRLANSDRVRAVGITQFVVASQDEDGETYLCTGQAGFGSTAFYKPVMESVVGQNYCSA